ncbi:MAG: MarR family transcriptional regulator [Acidimicrobiales bacterium]|nr:MarR family transcriptional regulator [Acidimicrobiales bacterium]
MSTEPLDYDPVQASRERWIERGWAESAPGMAAVASVMRVDQIFGDRAATILRPLGLTFARYQVLGMLRWSGPLTLGAVSRRLWITPPTVTSAINRLEAAALCQRVPHPTDARATLVEISRDGSRVFDDAVDRLNDGLFGSLTLDGGVLTADEVEVLLGLLGKIRAAAGDLASSADADEVPT